jgi:hypothetical protein
LINKQEVNGVITDLTEHDGDKAVTSSRQNKTMTNKTAVYEAMIDYQWQQESSNSRYRNTERACCNVQLICLGGTCDMQVSDNITIG